MTVIRVTRVHPLPGGKLDLVFSDGTAGIADLSADLDGPLRALTDPAIWSLAHLERGVVTWTDALDIASELLYARAHQLPPPLHLG
jgi:hypothetical protein